MGLLDAILKNPQMLSDIGKFAMDNPQIAKAAMGLISSQEGTPGGSGGLGGVLAALQSNGLDDVVSSWLGSGDNKAVEPKQLEAALGNDTMSQFAQQAGIDAGEASAVLAGLLPGLVDQLSPDGQVPDSQGLEGALGGLMSKLGAMA